MTFHAYVSVRVLDTFVVMRVSLIWVLFLIRRYYFQNSTNYPIENCTAATISFYQSLFKNNVSKLLGGVGSVAFFVLKFVCPSKPILRQYTNQAKNNKLEGGVLSRRMKPYLTILISRQSVLF